MYLYKVELFLEQREVAFLSPSKKDFPKISENGLSEKCFDFASGFLLSRKTQMTKKSNLSQVYVRILYTYWQNQAC